MDFKRKDFLEDIYLGVIYLKWTYTEHLTREHLYIFSSILEIYVSILSVFYVIKQDSKHILKCYF